MMFPDDIKNRPILITEAVMNYKSHFASYEEMLEIMKSWRKGKKDSFENVVKSFDIKLTRFEKLVLKGKMTDNYKIG